MNNLAKNLLLWLVIAVVLMSVFNNFGNRAAQPRPLDYSQFYASVGEGRVEKTTPFKYALAEGQDIGEDTGSPIDFSYTPPFRFTGKLGKVTVELKGDGGTVGGR